MAGKWVSTESGAHLSGRAKVNTAPEILLRKAVHAQGGRFRLHSQIAKGCTPDFVLPGRRVAVFVDGCFWHGCPEHGRKSAWTGPNAALWEDKMRRNVERDKTATRLAREHGWTVVRVWECEVKEDAERAAARVLSPGPQDGL